MILVEIFYPEKQPLSLKTDYLMANLKKQICEERGNTLMEYIFLASLVSAVLVVVLYYYGTAASKSLSRVGSYVAQANS
ncbi:MAG: hypothetical protein PHC51_00620 [bacterium]|nr:hypothetical protein [bacterium]